MQPIPAQPLTANATFQIDLSTLTPNVVTGAILQNLSGYTLTVVSQGDQWTLPPGMNDWIPLTPTTGSVLTILVGASNAAPNVPLQQLQGTVYETNDKPPQGYPMVNPAFVTAVSLISPAVNIGTILAPNNTVRTQVFNVPSNITVLLFLTSAINLADTLQVTANYFTSLVDILDVNPINPNLVFTQKPNSYWAYFNQPGDGAGNISVKYTNNGNIGAGQVQIMGFAVPPTVFNGPEQPLWIADDKRRPSSMATVALTGGAAAALWVPAPPGKMVNAISFVSFVNIMTAAGTLVITGATTGTNYVEQGPMPINTQPTPIPWNFDLTVSEALNATIGGTGTFRISGLYRTLPEAA